LSPGRIDGNPFQAFARAAAERAGLRFVLNVVLDPYERVVAAAAGAPGAVHDALVPQARAAAEAPVDGVCDVAVLGVAAPKDANLYQASRAITYLALAAAPAVRPGAPLVLAARCPEGAGQGAGERHFLAAMRAGATPSDVLAQLRARPSARASSAPACRPGARASPGVGRGRDALESCHMTPAPNVAALDALARETRGARAGGEDGIHVLPMLW
jgi:nickel-dependent lactate racemase